MHDVEIAERYGLLLEMYLGACGCHRRELLKQNDVMEKLISVAAAVKDTSKSRRPEVIREQLRAIELPSEFTLPLNPRWKCKGLVVDGCRSMSSKKVPLWLEFENGEAGCPNFLALFKEGDDLRQDLLTLQLLRIMDNIWKKEGKDLKLIPYGCVSTGNELGCAIPPPPPDFALALLLFRLREKFVVLAASSRSSPNPTHALGSPTKSGEARLVSSTKK